MKSSFELLRRPANAALAFLAIFTLTSVLGYWNFALHPERLPSSPVSLKFYSIAFQFFAQLHIVIAAATLALFLVRRIGWHWWLALIAVYVLSFTAEHMGTGYGVPFGGYAYTGLLGAKLGGRVPALIPLSWFLMALPAWVIARAAAPEAGQWTVRLGLGALWLTVWDLALDPAMSYLTPYWLWEDSGPYYGMPWLNLLGWFTTGVVLMAAIDALADVARLDSLPVRWMGAYYAVVAALPLGMVMVAGLWPAVIVTLAGMAGAAGITWVAHRGGFSAAAPVGNAPSPVTSR
jgi:putative membrane protein